MKAKNTKDDIPTLELNCVPSVAEVVKKWLSSSWHFELVDEQTGLDLNHEEFVKLLIRKTNGGKISENEIFHLGFAIARSI